MIKSTTTKGETLLFARCLWVISAHLFRRNPLFSHTDHIICSHSLVVGECMRTDITPSLHPGLPWRCVVMEPGMMLFIPSGTWHFVESHGTCIMASMWHPKN